MQAQSVVLALAWCVLQAALLSASVTDQITVDDILDAFYPVSSETDRRSPVADPTGPPADGLSLIGQGLATPPQRSTDPTRSTIETTPGTDFFDPPGAPQPPVAPTTSTPSIPAAAKPMTVGQPPSTDTFFNLPTDHPVDADLDLLGQDPRRKEGD